jgi:hypothetical protein
MYDESPATRDTSESVLPPMCASMNSSREKRRVLPFTTRCAAALNVSWGTCPRGQDPKINKFWRVIYRRDREPERRVRYRRRGRRLRAVNKDDCTTCVKCGPDGIVFVVAYVLYTPWQMGSLKRSRRKRTSFTSFPVRRRDGHTHRAKLVKNIGDEFKSP